MPKILVYTFFSYTKNCSKILYQFDNPKYKIDKLFVPNRFSTDKLLKAVPKYGYVIGIADHSKNASKSRFDPKYINRYSKSPILEDGEEYFISNLDIDIPKSFYRFEGVTNGPCNRSGYLVMNEIVNNNLKTRFGFFHINKESVLRDLNEILEAIY